MDERRNESRLLCADLVEVVWKDKAGSQRRRVANLEDISLSGLCLQLETPISRNTPVQVLYGDGELVGHVRYCFYRDSGYFLGIELGEGCKWSSKHFRPRHLLDPRRLTEAAIRRVYTPAPSRTVN